MYLTEAWLTADVALRRRLYDSYDWHQCVWEAFPGHKNDSRAFLTRVDVVRDRFRLYILSEWAPQRPSWWPRGELDWRTRPIPDSFFRFRHYAFQLCANPTRKVAKVDEAGNPSKNGRRDPLRTRQELEGWIVRKGEQGGFRPDLETMRILPLGRRYFQRRGGGGMHTAVDYRGILEVTDAEKFREAFRRGIGPAKAFGFGLLLLAPLANGRRG
jgi:CRISPR system Cascade subunit CasE